MRSAQYARHDDRARATMCHDVPRRHVMPVCPRLLDLPAIILSIIAYAIMRSQPSHSMTHVPYHAALASQPVSAPK